ncbi:hypothetical protein [Methanoregula sp.]|uniref:hypothetical protein n=1 Tax=Methanoregula sp. TaxID=2052170 RepID=UPI003BAE3C60
MNNSEKEMSVFKHYCKRLQIEIINEHKEDDYWYLTLKTGDGTILLLEKKRELDHCLLFYTVKYTDPKLIEQIEKVDLDPQFIYGIKSAIFDPEVTMVFIPENGHLRGYHLSRRLFPHESTFSVRDFDNAVRALSAVGGRGLAFINSVLGHQQVIQKSGEDFPKTSPDGMFY